MEKRKREKKEKRENTRNGRQRQRAVKKCRPIQIHSHSLSIYFPNAMQDLALVCCILYVKHTHCVCPQRVICILEKLEF